MIFTLKEMFNLKLYHILILNKIVIIIGNVIKYFYNIFDLTLFVILHYINYVS